MVTGPFCISARKISPSLKFTKTTGIVTLGATVKPPVPISAPADGRFTIRTAIAPAFCAIKAFSDI